MSEALPKAFPGSFKHEHVQKMKRLHKSAVAFISLVAQRAWFGHMHAFLYWSIQYCLCNFIAQSFPSHFQQILSNSTVKHNYGVPIQTCDDQQRSNAVLGKEHSLLVPLIESSTGLISTSAVYYTCTDMHVPHHIYTLHTVHLIRCSNLLFILCSRVSDSTDSQYS